MTELTTPITSLFSEVVAGDFVPERYVDDMRKAFQARYEIGSDGWTNDETTATLTNKVCRMLMSASSDAAPLVVDIGCGKGRDVAHCVRHGFRAIGVDLVPQPEWTALVRDSRERASFVAEDFVTWAENEDVLAEAVVDNGCFHHQHPAHRGQYLSAVHRMLKPGGIFAATLFATEFRKDDVDSESGMAAEGGLFALSDGRLSKEYSEDEIEALLASSGFRAVSVERVERPGFGLDFLHVIAKREVAHEG
jgi:SAM-dependent methyltransferase